ncbi:MAG: PEP-CTERM sorting domain-containing protein [Candidatus Scalindua sp.]|nr:PEP-CTERM sorting domain-containing protein [Candidatus Scalindua sp.]
MVVSVFLIMESNVFAAPVNISDTYWGSKDHGHEDVIGADSKFGISSMDVELIGNILSVDINTSFGGKGDDGSYSGITINGLGIGYGDLFLSSAWTPDPNSALNNYLTDDHSTGTLWSYGVKLDNNWGYGGSVSSKNVATLYEFAIGGSNADNAILTDALFSSGTFRDGQEVRVNDGSSYASPLSNDASWYSDSGVVNFEIDLTGTSLLNGPEIALHWGPTCGNDTIEGSYKIPAVPEPGTIALLGIGLAGLAGVGARRRLKKKAVDKS